MSFISKREFKTLSILFLVVFVIELLFGGVSVQIKTAFSHSTASQQQVAAATGACGTDLQGLSAEISVPINHEICKNPKAVTCGVIPIGTYGYVNTVCSAGCCKAVGYSAPPSLNITGNKFLDSLLSNAAMQGVSSVLGSLFSGGGGDSSYTGASGIEFRNATEEEEYLQFNAGALGDNEEISAFNLAFDLGGGTSDNSTTLVYEKSEESEIITTDDEVQSTEEETSGAAEALVSQDTPEVTVHTSDTQEVATLPGEEGFEQDYSGISFNTSGNATGSRGLSLSDLEYEAQQQAILMNEQQGLSQGNLRDYRSSNIAQSNDKVEDNPLSNTRYDALGSEESETKTSWWQNMVLFVGKILGLAQ